MGSSRVSLETKYIKNILKEIEPDQADPRASLPPWPRASLAPPHGREDGDSTVRDGAQQALRMDSASCYLPEHDEDAHFCRGKRVDAAAFSRGLMASAFSEVASAVPGTHAARLALHAVLEGIPAAGCVAHAAVIHGTHPVTGRQGPQMGVPRDSAFAVFRGGKLVHRSRPQQLCFKCPFQLRAAGGNRISDAAVGEVPVEEGDVVVAGSDGLFDNVFGAVLERIVQMGAALSFTPKNMADIMASYAYGMASYAYVMARSRRDSPFSVASQEQHGTDFSGGKPDDITVIVAFIVS